ncbi:MAG: hypothetical protein JNK20_00960 [Flavipsychrobacter sp.]|nr:hypothetical protein [Flavipsychrobacter sp.]
MIEEFQKLALWKKMLADSRPEDIAITEKHALYILPLMEHYADTFPTYTLHNKLHVYNIVKLMGDLLGPEINKLHSLEAIVLILSAIYHDFGMVYNTEEREKILHERKFSEVFLQELPSARVQFEANGRIISKDLAEWYCRWAHAERVWKKLEETENICGELLYNGVSIRAQIGIVCESHNEPAENIRIDDGRFDPNFLHECDIRFCALLLRLADILDFDNSRSPQSVYDYLDLDNPKNRAEKISKDEWQKHMASRGFTFPDNPSENPLPFIAAPPHPYIEQGIRKFLDLIDLELNAASKVTRYCNERWRSFPFPEKIDRHGIVSTDYISGNYRFSLSEDKILDLLTGDDLYSDDFVFIRELLQNAIDTVRHRTYIERITNPDYKPSPIEVSFFQDAEGYYWFRIDDHGMGMNNEIIRSYLLEKGNSYYNSDLFKLEKIRINEKIDEEFVPISRFGIGLLSCFMMCDKIEINSTYYYPFDNTNLTRNRLTVEGRSGFWVIRSEQKHHKPAKMPSENGWENGYREMPGTAIACRIKTSREFHGLRIEAQLERFLLAPEIPILFEGRSLGGDRDELVNKPWCEYSRTPLPDEFIVKCRELLNLKIKSIEIEIRPIDVTKKSATKNLAGQMVLVVPRIIVEDVPEHFNIEPYFNLNKDPSGSKIICIKKEKDEKGNEIRKEESYDIAGLIKTIKFPEKFVEEDGRSYPFRWPRVSHNGIVVYDNEQQLVVSFCEFDQYRDYARHHQNFYFTTGLLCFRDNLLPNVTVSRSLIKNFPPEIIANLMYATRELNEYTNSPFRLFGYYQKLEHSKWGHVHYALAALERSSIYNKDVEYWNSLPCMTVKDKGLYSIAQALEEVKQGPLRFRTISNERQFYQQFSKFIISKNFMIRYVDNNGDYYLEGILPDNNKVLETEVKNYEPLTFILGDDATKIVLRNQSLNLANPIVYWYLTWNDLIRKEFYYFGIQLVNNLLSETVLAEKIAAVNGILERLSILLPEAAKPSKDDRVDENSFYPQKIY